MSLRSYLAYSKVGRQVLVPVGDSDAVDLPPSVCVCLRAGRTTAGSAQRAEPA